MPKTKRARKVLTCSVGTTTSGEILTPTAGTLRIKTERFEKTEREAVQQVMEQLEKDDMEYKYEREVATPDDTPTEIEAAPEDHAEKVSVREETPDPLVEQEAEREDEKKDVIPDVQTAEIERSPSPPGASISSESDPVVTHCSAAAATAIVLSMTSSTVSSPMLTSGSPSSFSLPVTKEGALQSFSVSTDIRLAIAPSLLKAGGSSRGLSGQNRPPNGFAGQVTDSSVSAVHQEVSTVVRHLQEQEWSRSRQLVKENYRRALQSWRHQHEARLSSGTISIAASESTDVGSKKQCTGPIIKKILGPQRLIVVGSFQPQRNKSDDQYIPPRETANSVSQRVTANHIESFPGLVSNPRKEKIRSVLSLGKRRASNGLERLL